MRPSPRRSPYRGSIRLWRRGAPLILALTLGLSAGGCSFSWKLDSLFGKKDEERPEHTASVEQLSRDNSEGLPAEVDLAYARAAVSDVLTRGGKNTSQPWENPRTGARGTVTPIATAYDQAGFTCRDFLASYVINGSESWMQGEACRIHQGRWEVRNLKPWRRS